MPQPCFVTHLTQRRPFRVQPVGSSEMTKLPCVILDNGNNSSNNITHKWGGLLALWGHICNHEFIIIIAAIHYFTGHPRTGAPNHCLKKKSLYSFYLLLFINSINIFPLLSFSI